MKKLFFTMLFCTLAMISFAQKQTFYCEIKGNENELSTGLKIVLDLGISPVYGGYLAPLKGKQKLVDENGDEIKFNSMVDAGNHLSGKGWKFLQAYSSVYGGSCILHWIFCKDASSIEEAMQGLQTKESYKKKNH